jgi:hypothetical protein
LFKVLILRAAMISAYRSISAMGAARVEPWSERRTDFGWVSSRSAR